MLDLILAVGFYLRDQSIDNTIVSQPLSHDAGDYARYAYNFEISNRSQRENILAI